MLEEEPFDLCLRRMKVIRFVSSFGDDDKAKQWISSADAAAWVAEEAGEGSPLLFLMFLLEAKNDHDVANLLPPVFRYWYQHISICVMLVMCDDVNLIYQSRVAIIKPPSRQQCYDHYIVVSNLVLQSPRHINKSLVYSEAFLPRLLRDGIIENIQGTDPPMAMIPFDANTVLLLKVILSLLNFKVVTPYDVLCKQVCVNLLFVQGFSNSLSAN
jgi:hypothetical protein